MALFKIFGICLMLSAVATTGCVRKASTTQAAGNGASDQPVNRISYRLFALLVGAEADGDRQIAETFKMPASDYLKDILPAHLVDDTTEDWQGLGGKNPTLADLVVGGDLTLELPSKEEYKLAADLHDKRQEVAESIPAPADIKEAKKRLALIVKLAVYKVHLAKPEVAAKMKVRNDVYTELLGTYTGRDVSYLFVDAKGEVHVMGRPTKRFDGDLSPSTGKIYKQGEIEKLFNTYEHLRDIAIGSAYSQRLAAPKGEWEKTLDQFADFARPSVADVDQDIKSAKARIEAEARAEERNFNEDLRQEANELRKEHAERERIARALAREGKSFGTQLGMILAECFGLSRSPAVSGEGEGVTANGRDGADDQPTRQADKTDVHADRPVETDGRVHGR